MGQLKRNHQNNDTESMKLTSILPSLLTAAAANAYSVERIEATSTSCQLPAIVTISHTLSSNDNTTALLQTCVDIGGYTEGFEDATLNLDYNQNKAYCLFFSGAGTGAAAPFTMFFEGMDQYGYFISTNNAKVPASTNNGWYTTKNLPVYSSHCEGITPDSDAYSLIGTRNFANCKNVCNTMGSTICNWFTWNKQISACTLNYVPSGQPIYMANNNGADIGNIWSDDAVFEDHYLTTNFVEANPSANNYPIEQCASTWVPPQGTPGDCEW